MRNFVVLFFLFPYVAFSQIDTLQQELDRREISIETVDWLNKTISPLQRTNTEALEKYARQALEMATDLDYPTGVADAHMMIGISFWARDLHDQAMEHYFIALDIFQETDNKPRVAKVLMNIGNTYDELSQTEKAKSFVQRAMAMFEELKDSSELITSKLNLGVIYFYENKFDSSLFFFEQVRDYRIKQKDSSSIALIYLNLANVYEFKDDMVRANEHYRLARNFVRPHELLLCNIYLGLGNGLLLVGREKEGLLHLDSGLHMAKETDQAYMQQVAYSSYRGYYERNKDFEQAYHYLDMEYELDGRIRGKQVQEEVEVVNLKYEGEKKARQLAVLENEKAQKQYYLRIAIVLGVAILIAAVLVISLLRLKVKNARLKESELKNELEHKSKELASYALNFIQKNELLNELTEKVNQLKNESPESSVKGLNQLNNMINGSMRIDQDWENFKMMFEEIHGNYFVRLKDSYPDLGNAELKLCALLRLNLNLKESSRILGISSDSVKTARSRLRKKLNLKTEENLVDFLIQFDSKTKHKMTA